jgi:hypothetical protein
VATDGEVLLRMNVGFYLAILHSHSRCSGDAFIPNYSGSQLAHHSGQMVALGALAMHRNIKWERVYRRARRSTGVGAKPWLRS